MKTCDKCGAEYAEDTQHECRADDLAYYRVDQRIAKFQADQEEREKRQQAQLDSLIGKIAQGDGEPQTPSRKVQVINGQAVQVHDRFDQLGYTRADFELAAMIFEGARRMTRSEEH